MIYSVWGTVALYSVFFTIAGAYFSAVMVGTGVVLLSPLCLYLRKKSDARLARIFFLISCNFYIYAASLGLGHGVDAEFYSVPALMLTLLINDLDDKIAIGIGGLLPLFTWALITVFGSSFVPAQFTVDLQLKPVFAIVNFLGAFALSAIFLMIFVRTIKQQRHRLIATAKMSSLGQMAGGMAHEINNPLAIISARAAIMRARIESGTTDGPTISKDLLKIEATTERIAKIIRGLRAFSRESDQDSMSIVDAKVLIEETFALCLEKIKIHGIRMTIKCPENIQILCRPAQISQVILNLVGNAIDAVEPLNDKWISLVVTNQDLISISITDSGGGIDPSVTEKMMEPFFTTKELGKGTGLGLSISKGIVEDHGGRLSYEKVGKHTRFVFSLPQAKTSATDAA